MKNKIIMILSIALLILTACNKNLQKNQKTLFIAAETQTCDSGVMKKECLKVKWTKGQNDREFFYDSIEGFVFVEGYEYELVIHMETIENPPADASSIKYKLVKLLSKNKVESIPINFLFKITPTFICLHNSFIVILQY